MSGPTLLLVEDNPDDVLLMRRAMKRCGTPADLAVAATGEEALERLYGAPGCDAASVEYPALVLLDLKLPGIDGIGVLRRIRSDVRTRKIPVVVLTTSRAPEDVDTCYELGANSYLQKPIEFDEFVAALDLVGKYWLRLNVLPVPGR